jgi:two-component system response regulator
MPVITERLVLLAEDDLGHAALFRKALARTEISCRLEIVEDGAEAINWLFGTGKHADRSPQEMPDLIFLDLKMPRMGGLEVLKVLRRVRGQDHLRYPPVIVLTCSDDDADIEEAYRWGAQSYISKPLSLPEYTEAVSQAVHYWLGLNRPVPKHRAGAPQYVHEGL